jgi:hypothetical protein
MTVVTSTLYRLQTDSTFWWLQEEMPQFNNNTIYTLKFYWNFSTNYIHSICRWLSTPHKIHKTVKYKSLRPPKISSFLDCHTKTPRTHTRSVREAIFFSLEKLEKFSRNKMTSKIFHGDSFHDVHENFTLVIFFQKIKSLWKYKQFLT